MRERNYGPYLSPQEFSSQGSSFEMHFIPEQSQEQELLQTEILQSFEKNEYSHSIFRNFSQFVKYQEDVIHSEPLKKTNFSISFGPPAAGKSNLHNQWLMEQLRSIAGDDSIDTLEKPLSLDGTEVRVYTFTWADAVIAARKLDIVPENLAFGEWSGEHLSHISQLAGRALDIAREGTLQIPGIEGKAVGLIGIDVPMSTATKIQFENGDSQIVGFDRFYSVADKLLNDPDTTASTFFAGVLPDALSQHRRLQEREALRLVNPQDKKKKWMSSTKTRVRKKDIEKAVQHFSERSASIDAATEIGKQMSQLLIYLDSQSEISLSEEEKNLLEKELRYINQDHMLTSPYVKKLQAEKLELIARELYPHMLRGLQLPQYQYFDGWNRDVDEVHFYPSLSEQTNLIQYIESVNPKLLLP